MVYTPYIYGTAGQILADADRQDDGDEIYDRQSATNDEVRESERKSTREREREKTSGKKKEVPTR